MRPKSILLLSEYFHPRVGGIETHVLALAQQLCADGVRAEVATACPGPEVVQGVRVHRILSPLLPGLGVVFTTHGVRPFERLLRTGEFDLVHGHLSVFGPASMGAVWLAQRMGIPTLVTFHSLIQAYHSAYELFDRVAGWSRLPIRWSAVSGRVADQIAPLVNGRPVDILPSAVDPEEWPPSPETRDDGVFTIVSTMRLAARKRPQALVGVIGEARRRLGDGVAISARLIGDGPERRSVERQVDRLGMRDSVTLLGACSPDQIREEYGRADVFALASVEESFGLAVLEARSCGLPVVVRRGTGPADLLKGGVEGLLADSDADLVECLVQLAQDTELRERITAHNRTRPTEFRWDECLARHMHVYRDMLQLSESI